MSLSLLTSITTMKTKNPNTIYQKIIIIISNTETHPKPQTNLA